MNRQEELLFKGQVLKWLREFFELEGIPEARYNQFSFAGSCENAPTTYWLDKDKEFLMLPQTRQILAEEDLIKHGLKAVYMLQTSYRDEPKAGDGRHTNAFLLCEMEHKDMSQDELIDFEERMLKFCIKRALDYFKDNPNLVTKENIGRLKYTLEVDMPRMTYTDIISMLQERGISITWGDDLKSRDEEFICGLFKDIPIPVAVIDYPEKLKYFNMFLRRETEGTDKETVACCDILLPFAGETWGSSQRENEGARIRKRFWEGTMAKQLIDRLITTQSIKKLSDENETSPEEEAKKVVDEAFEDYFRLFDDKPHDRSGFGMGCGRLAQFLLGINTIVEI